MSTKPLGTRTLQLTIDGEDYTADVSKVALNTNPADSDFTSFADAAAGGKRKYTLAFTATQDPADPDSIWSKVWNHNGEVVPCTVLPYGGGAISATNPAVVGNLKIAEPDGTLLGGEADASSTAKFTMDLEWEYEAKPTLDITP